MTASALIIKTNLNNYLIPDGIYAIKGSRLIPLDGNAELPLYKEVIERGNYFPRNETLMIISGFGKNIKGTDFDNLVDYNGVYSGDFYRVSVNFAERKNNMLYFKSNLGGLNYSYKDPQTLNLEDRKILVRDIVSF